MTDNAILCTKPPSLDPSWLSGGALTALALVLAACSSQPGGESTESIAQALDAGQFVLLNEVEIDPPNANAPYQYIELIGSPGATLSGFQVVYVNGATSRAQMVVDLGADCGGPCVNGSNGIFMIKAADSGGPVGHDPAAGTGVYKDVQLNGTALVTSDPAVLLVQGSVAIAENALLAADGGTAVLPAGDTLVDGVGWSGGGHFAGVTLTQAQGTTDAAVRIPGSRAHAASAWYNGALVGGSASVTFAAAANQRSANFPAGGALTPGAPNVPAENDGGAEADAPSPDAGEAAVDAAPEATADATPEATVDAVADVRADAVADQAVVDAVADRQADAVADTQIDSSPADSGAPDAVADATDARANDGAGGATGTGGAGGTGGTGTGGAGGTGGRTGTGGTGGTVGTGGTGGTVGTGGGGTAGTIGAGGNVASGGRGGAGTAGGGGSSTAATGGSATTPPGSDDSGCGCRVPGQRPSSGSSALALFGLAALFAARRDKRRSASRR